MTSHSTIEQIAKTVLYEGYILYPYRPSVKNRQRWTFGGLIPRHYSESNGGDEPWMLHAECLVRGDSQTTVDVSLRFLRLIERSVEQLLPPMADEFEVGRANRRVVESLRVGDNVHYSWQEAEEQKIAVESSSLGSLLVGSQTKTFHLPPRIDRQQLRDPEGLIVGLLTRERKQIIGDIELNAQQVDQGIFRIGMTVRNQTPLSISEDMTRDRALLHGLVSTHAVLNVEQGEFVSLTDPPMDCKEYAFDCQNFGVWPVLVGEEGSAKTMLASPIILYDYPCIAPESPGDLFDATEVDEILSLRIMTLTDEEKESMAAIDPRARDLLARTETLAREQLMGLHGTIRGLRPFPGENGHE